MRSRHLRAPFCSSVHLRVHMGARIALAPELVSPARRAKSHAPALSSSKGPLGAVARRPARAPRTLFNWHSKGRGIRHSMATGITQIEKGINQLGLAQLQSGRVSYEHSPSRARGAGARMLVVDTNPALSTPPRPCQPLRATLHHSRLSGPRRPCPSRPQRAHRMLPRS
jgi:hypothetical protein